MNKTNEQPWLVGIVELEQAQGYFEHRSPLDEADNPIDTAHHPRDTEKPKSEN